MSDAVFKFKNFNFSFVKKNLFLIFGAYPIFGDHRFLSQKGRPTSNWLRAAINIFAWKAEVEGDTFPPAGGGGRCTTPRYRLTVPTICSNSHALITGGDALLIQVIGLRYLIYRYTVLSMYPNSHALPPPPGGGVGGPPSCDLWPLLKSIVFSLINYFFN